MKRVICILFLTISSILISASPFVDINAGLTGVNWSSTAWGDYDNDNDLDVIVSGYTGSVRTTKIYRNDSSGVFTDINVAMEQVNAGSLEWGDYDNDGDLDILLTGSNDTIWITRIYHNNGDETFTDINAGITGAIFGGGTWGDYDNDGDLDIAITGDTGSGYVSEIFRNDGSGIFTDINAGLTPVTNSSVSWGDYDNDGDLDLVLTGNTGTGYVSKVYRNNNGVFTDINAGLTGVYLGSSAWGDYDSDGYLDLILTGNNGSNDTTTVYRNDGIGTFTNIGCGITGVSYGSVKWGDCDNDGDLDVLITGVSGTSEITEIYSNEGSDTFINFNAGITEAGNSSSSWGDYDNDNDLDIIVTGYSDTKYFSKIYRNDCITPNTAPKDPNNLTVIVSGNDAALSWNKASDEETLQDGLTYNIYISSKSGEADTKSPMSDLSTGYRKVVAIGNTTQKNSWTVKGLPTGIYYWSVQAVDNAFSGSKFAAEETFFVPPEIPVATAASNITLTQFTANWLASSDATGYKIDVDNDSDFSSPLSGYNDLDLTDKLSCIVYNLSVDSTYYYRVRAYNSYGTSENSNLIGVSTLSYFTDINAGLEGIINGSTEWGDFDNDGDKDILLTGFTGSVRISKIYRNDNGVFTDINAGLEGISNGTAKWGDYDNDGDLDILLLGYNGIGQPWNSYVSKIYRNDNGNFTNINAGLIGLAWGDAAWGDYDNDGDLDIAITGSTGAFPIIITGSPEKTEIGPVTKIYKNDLGVFTDINAGLPGVYNSSVAWGDYDNDGDLDLLLSGYLYLSSNPTTEVFQNDSGIFTNINAISIALYNSSVAWGDADNDGDLDVLLTGFNNSEPITSVLTYEGGNTYNGLVYSLSGVSEGSAVWGDYDNDGFQDVLVAGSGLCKIYARDSVSYYESVDNTGLFGVNFSSTSWGDYDNDGDLDILLTGSYFNPADSTTINISKILRNNLKVNNTVPTKPSRLITSLTDHVLHLSFNPSTDSQTPQVALSYNINIAINGLVVTPTMSDASNGFRRVVERGNITNNRNYYLRNITDNLPQEEKYLIWGVQAIDYCFAGSEFASTDEIIFPSPRDLIITSNTLMTETDLLKWESVQEVDHYMIQLDDDEYFQSPIDETYIFSKTSLKEKSDDGKIIYLTKRLNELENFGEMISNETYYWRLKPVYTKTNCVTIFSETPHSFLFNPTGTAPNPPISGFNPANDDIESSLPKLSWNVAVDPDGHAEDLYYICQLDTANAFTTIQYADTTAAGISSIQVASALPEGYRYYYRVKTVDADALQSVWSAYQTFLVVMPPQDVKITDDGTNVNLTWDAIPVNTKGVVYTVYSSANPYAEFPTGWTVAAAQLTSPAWAEPHSAAKKFYRITAGSSSK